MTSQVSMGAGCWAGDSSQGSRAQVRPQPGCSRCVCVCACVCVRAYTCVCACPLTAERQVFRVESELLLSLPPSCTGHGIPDHGGPVQSRGLCVEQSRCS